MSPAEKQDHFWNGIVESVGVIQMQDIVGNYDVPQSVPEWEWVEKHASFTHVRNGQGEGVLEFILNLALDFTDIPLRLVPVIAEGRRKLLAYLVIHQGT
jgi:hypothetical protein